MSQHKTQLTLRRETVRHLGERNSIRVQGGDSSIATSPISISTAASAIAESGIVSLGLTVGPAIVSFGIGYGLSRLLCPDDIYSAGKSLPPLPRPVVSVSHCQDPNCYEL